MKYRLAFAPTADRTFWSLPRRVQRRFDLAFALLERDPQGSGSTLDTHQLYGYRNVWTLRIELYRGIYAVDGGEVVMVVFGRRDTIYTVFHNLFPPERQSLTKSALDRHR